MKNPLVTILPDESKKPILAFGVGGQGGHVIETLAKEQLDFVSLLAINTDLQDLEKLKMQGIPVMPIGLNTVKGEGAGGFGSKGAEAVRENIEEISDYIDRHQQKFGASIALIYGGAGGGTGSGAAPVLAKLCLEKHLTTICVFTLPFQAARDSKVYRVASACLKEAEQSCNAIILVDNNAMYHEKVKQSVAFANLDDRVGRTTACIVRLLEVTPRENLDLADFRSVFLDDGSECLGKVCVMGYGVGRGDKRLTGGVKDAIKSKVLFNNDITGAGKVLFHYLTSEEHELDTTEFNNLLSGLRSMAKNPNLQFVRGGGASETVNDDEFQISIVATDFADGKTASQLYEELTDKITRELNCEPPNEDWLDLIDGKEGNENEPQNQLQPDQEKEEVEDKLGESKQPSSKETVSLFEEFDSVTTVKEKQRLASAGKKPQEQPEEFQTPVKSVNEQLDEYASRKGYNDEDYSDARSQVAASAAKMHTSHRFTSQKTELQGNIWDAVAEPEPEELAKPRRTLEDIWAPFIIGEQDNEGRSEEE